MNHPLFVITGPSAAGKTTIMLRIRASFPELSRIVTRTTRPPREGEKNGVDYHFVSREKFIEYGHKDELVEFAQVHGQHLYGTIVSDVSEVIKTGPALAVVDPQGARAYATQFPEAHCIFVSAPRDQMRSRLLLRGGTVDDFNARMKSVDEEILSVAEPQYELIVNNANRRLEHCVEQITEFIRKNISKS